LIKIECFRDKKKLLIPILLTAIPHSGKIHGAYLVENTILEMDSLSSVNSGITNAVKDFLGLSISSIWMASNVVTFQLKLSFYFSNTFYHH
jgi:hypothetical protein